MSPNAPRRRPQVSVLNLLFLGTAVAAIAGLYGSWQTIRELQAELSLILEENTKLRAEQGVLTIEDPTKVYAIRVADPRSGVWSYRVYLPTGRKYYLACQANGLPMNGETPSFAPGPPPGLSTIRSGQSSTGGDITANGCSPGEHLVSVALSRNDQGKKILRVKMSPTSPGSSGAMIGLNILEEPNKWPTIENVFPDRKKPPLSYFESGIAARRQTMHPIESAPLVLLEKRFMHGGVMSSADSDEGILVWIGRADEQP